MRHSIQIAILSLIIISLFSSCMTMSTMQDAKTLGKGETQVNVGASRINYSLEGVEEEAIVQKGFVGEVDVRRGITDKLDVGLKVALLGTSGGYAKYQFLGDQDSKFAASATLGLGRLSITSGETKVGITDIYLPVNFSYHPTDWVSVYASPRYNFRMISSEGERGSEHWLGATGGLRLGKKVAGFVEYSFFDSKENEKPIGQLTGGVSFNF